MASKFEIVVKWSTDTPAINCPRKSPNFLVYNNECFFNFIPTQIMGFWFYFLYLEVKCTNSEFKSCRGKLQVGLVKEETLSWDNKEFEVSKPGKEQIWIISQTELQKKLPSDYKEGNWIQFHITFDDVTYGSATKISKLVDDKSVQTPRYIDTSFLLEGVSKDLSTLFIDGPNHDVEFICGNHTFKAHKNILCCRSDVLASMLQSDMSEGKSGQVKILDIEGDVFEQFLRYLYTGTFPELTVDNALELYQVADKYAVCPLKKQCVSFLVEHLSPENASQILIVSDRHSDPDFKKKVIEYVVEKAIPFPGEKLSNFCKDNATLAAEVLNLFCLNLREKKIIS